MQLVTNEPYLPCWTFVEHSELKDVYDRDGYRLLALMVTNKSYEVWRSIELFNKEPFKLWIDDTKDCGWFKTLGEALFTAEKMAFADYENEEEQ